MRLYFDKRFWKKFVCVILVLVTGCANNTELPDEKISWTESFTTDLFNLPDEIIEDSITTFSKSDNLIPLMLAGSASIAMHNTNADDNIAGDFDVHPSFKGFPDKSFDLIGGPGFHFAVTGLWYALSVENGDDFNKHRAWTMMRALSVTGMTTLALKAARNNKTPNGKSWAWPSGHTSSSFTVASVLDEFYGPKIGIPAYIGASVVGWRMMDTGDHWASDVVFGATLGWIVGHSVAGKHKNIEIAGFEVIPYTFFENQSAIGITLLKRF